MTKVGDRVELLAPLGDRYTRLQPGAVGTVRLIDSLGTVHVKWDGGRVLGLIPGEDSWREVEPVGEVEPVESFLIVVEPFVRFVERRLEGYEAVLADWEMRGPIADPQRLVEVVIGAEMLRRALRDYRGDGS